MWVIFKPPPKPIDFVLLALHTDSFVELVLGKPAAKFHVAIQKPFDAHGSNQSTLFYILGIFDTYNEGLEFALDIIDALKNGKTTFELLHHFSPNTDDKKEKVDNAYL